MLGWDARAGQHNVGSRLGRQHIVTACCSVSRSVIWLLCKDPWDITTILPAAEQLFKNKTKQKCFASFFFFYRLFFNNSAWHYSFIYLFFLASDWNCAFSGCLSMLLVAFGHVLYSQSCNKGYKYFYKQRIIWLPVPEDRACPGGTFAEVKNPVPSPALADQFQNLPRHERGSSLILYIYLLQLSVLWKSKHKKMSRCPAFSG